jgi:hypothetical protein
MLTGAFLGARENPSGRESRLFDVGKVTYTRGLELDPATAEVKSISLAAPSYAMMPSFSMPYQGAR